MNLRLSNQLNMVGACLRAAQSREHCCVWLGQEPRDFAVDLDGLEAGYKIALGKAALADTSRGGASDARGLAETALENAAFVLARALAVHFKKTGDLKRREQVDLAHTQIVQLRDHELIAKTKAIRSVARTAVAEAEAAARGVTPARIDALSHAIEAFHAVLGQPRGNVITRGMLLRELETDMAALIEQLRDLDDLVLQFDGSAAGLRFIAAWEKARLVNERVADCLSKTPAGPA